MKRNIVMMIICLAAVWMMVFGLSKCFVPDYEQVPVSRIEPLVFVTTYGVKYHSENCHHLKSSRHPIGEEKAKSKGYTACSHCDGVAYEYTVEEYVERKERSNTPIAIVIASVASPPVTALIAVTFYLRAKPSASRNA